MKQTGIMTNCVCFTHRSSGLSLSIISISVEKGKSAPMKSLVADLGSLFKVTVFSIRVPEIRCNNLAI